MDFNNKPKSLFFPLLLIALGILLLLDTMRMIPGGTWDAIWRLWPLVFIVGGLDGLYQRNGFIGSILFIGLGSILLLGNLGYLEVSPWGMALRLWPVLLIAFGLDLLIGRRSVVSAVLGLLLGIVLVGGVFFLAFSATDKIQNTALSISQPLGDAQRASMVIEANGGILKLKPGASEDMLVEGELRLGRQETISQDYSLRQSAGFLELRSSYPVNGFPFLVMNTGDLLWDLRLNQDYPLDLSTRLIAGEQDLQLETLQVELLNTETVFGRTILSLPSHGNLSGGVKVVIGELLLQVPKDVPVILHVNTGIASTSLPEDYRREDKTVYSPQARAGTKAQIELQVEVPIGNLRVEYLP